MAVYFSPMLRSHNFPRWYQSFIPVYMEKTYQKTQIWTASQSILFHYLISEDIDVFA